MKEESGLLNVMFLQNTTNCPSWIRADFRYFFVEVVTIKEIIFQPEISNCLNNFQGHILLNDAI